MILLAIDIVRKYRDIIAHFIRLSVSENNAAPFTAFPTLIVSVLPIQNYKSMKFSKENY